MNTFTPGTGTIEYDGSGAQTVVTGLGAYNNLTLSGSDTKTLGGNTTVNGALTVAAGSTLALSTFTLGTPTSISLECGATSGSSITGSGTLTLGGNVTVTDVNTGANGASIACPVALGSAGRTFQVADDGTGAADLTISGVISNPTTARSVTKTGAGALVLSNANTYSNGTNVIVGTLAIGINDALGTGELNLGGTNANTPTITASGGARIIANNVVLLATSLGGTPPLAAPTRSP